MDLLIEFLGGIFLEGLVEVIKSKKISLWIRIPLFLVISLLYLGIVSLMVYACIKNFKSDLIMAIILLILSFVLLNMYFLFIYKLYKGTLK